MNRSIHLSTCIGLLCLVPVIGFSQEEEPAAEIPQGYEDAGTAGEPAPVMEAAVEEERGSLLEVLTEALADDVDPNVANLEKQFLPQFRPIVRAELSFIRRVCRLTEDQRKQIGEAGNRCLNAAVRKYAIAQNDTMHGRLRPVGGRSPAMPDPRKLIQQQFADFTKRKLRPEQAKRYLEEIDKRNANRKRVAVRSLVARLDQDLVLTAKQREELTESLSSNWQDAWGQSLEMWIHDVQFIPAVPDQHVVRFLNKTQQTVWRGAQRQDHVHMGLGFGQAMVVVDDFDEAADPFEE